MDLELSAIAEVAEPLNDLQVKDEGSPPERSSPPPNCVICMDRCRDKSFTDSCLHEFCFTCLVTWSKVKAECPLCKQPFTSIIHNIQPNHQYDEYPVQTVNYAAAHRFRYRTTLTIPRRESLMAIQHLLLESYHALNVSNVSSLHHNVTSTFRRNIYRNDMWAQPLPDFMGRYRDCSPTYFSHYEGQLHRLVPWMNRELSNLLNENHGHTVYVTSRILELLPRVPIISDQFRNSISNFFGIHSEHFAHELFVYAATPYDILAYDRTLQYTTRDRALEMRQVVANSLGLMTHLLPMRTESIGSDSSGDSDVLLVDTLTPVCIDLTPSAIAGPSRGSSGIVAVGENAIREIENIRQMEPFRNIPIETIGFSSDDDDNDDVIVVGYVKPPHERTPEVVDLLASDADSDVILQESEPAELAGHESNLVKFKLKALPQLADTWSDPEPPPLNVDRRRSSGSDSSSDYAPSDSSDHDSTDSLERKPKKRKYVKKAKSKKRKRSKCSDRSDHSRKKKVRSAKDANSSRRYSESTISHDYTQGRTSPQAGPSGLQRVPNVSQASTSHASQSIPRRLRSVVTAVRANNFINSGDDASLCDSDDDNKPLASTLLQSK